MTPNGHFRRNMALVAALHVVALVSLARWSGGAKKPARSDILWIDGGTAGGALTTAAVASTAPEPGIALPEPVPAVEPAAEPEQTEPILAAAPSEIEMPTPTVTPIATPSAIPRVTVTPRPTAAAKPTPKLSPKPSAKPSVTPKSSPKKTRVAKASPPARPPETATPRPPEESVSEKKVEVGPVPPMKDAAEPSTSTTQPAAGEPKAAPGTAAKAGTGGSGGRGTGPGGASQFGWYSRMLHDRFFGAWVQPTTVVTSGAKMSTLVKLRIEKDGRVSSFAIVRSSGNVVVDESVEAVAKRVTQVDALPTGLSDGPYDVTINFELRSE